MTPGPPPPPPNPLSPGNLGCVKALHASFGRESAARGVFPPSHSPPRSLSAAFPVYVQPRDTFPPNPYLPCQPVSPELAFAIFQSLPLPACPVPVPPRGFYGHCRGQETAHGFLQLCTGCGSARAEAGGRQTGIGSAESPSPSARFFQRERQGRRTGPPAAADPPRVVGCERGGRLVLLPWVLVAAKPRPRCPPGGGRGGGGGRKLWLAGSQSSSKFPPAVPWHGEVEPWPWAAPRQSSARAASTLGAGSLYTQRDRFAVIPEAAAPQSPGEGLGGAGCSPSPV